MIGESVVECGALNRTLSIHNEQHIAISAWRKGLEWQLALGPAQPLADAKVDADSIRYSATIGAIRN